MANRSRGRGPRAPTRKERARAKIAAERAAQQRRDRRRRLLWIGATSVVVVAIVAAVLAVELSQKTTPSPTAPVSDVATTPFTGPPGPEGIVLEQGTALATAATSAVGQTVAGVQCTPGEQVVYHIHTHLAVFVNGRLRPVPPGIGIVSPVAAQTAEGSFYSASRCYYWLHVHAQDGIIHVESPTVATYTLGQFFAIWGQPLSSHQVGPASGTLTVYVGGRRYTGDPAKIVLRSHEDIQIDVGTVVPPQKVDWSHSQL